MFSAPGMSAAHGHVVVDRSMSSGTATSHAQDTLLPWRTARAAASRAVRGVRRLGRQVTGARGRVK